jgi:hypothetical protein
VLILTPLVLLTSDREGGVSAFARDAAARIASALRILELGKIKLIERNKLFDTKGSCEEWEMRQLLYVLQS